MAVVSASDTLRDVQVGLCSHPSGVSTQSISRMAPDAGSINSRYVLRSGWWPSL